MGHIAASQCRPGCHLEGMSSRTTAYLLNSVPRGLEENDVDFVEEDASQKPKTGSQDGNHLHSGNKLPIGACIGWNKRDPNNEENQHAESDEFGLVKVFRQLAGFEGKEETDGSQEACVSNQEAQCHQGALIAGDKDDLVLQLMVPEARRGSCVQPNDADDYLHKSAQEDEQELQI